MTLFLNIILSINGKKKRGHISYDTYLNENFYLIKINNPPPKIYDSAEIIMISIEELISINFSLNTYNSIKR